MAEFGPSMTEAPQTPNFVTPKEGIVKEPVAVEGLTNIFAGVRAVRKAGREKQAEAFLSRFTQQQLAIVQSVDQGKRNSQYGRTMMRNNLMQAINDYPSLRKELIAANGSIIGAGGMGSLITEGTKAENRYEKAVGVMINEGYISPDADDATISKALENFQLASEAKRRYDVEMQTIQLERNEAGLQKDKLELLDAKEVRVSEQLLVSVMPNLMDRFKETSERLLRLSGTEGWPPSKVVELIETQFTQLQSELAPYGAKVGSHYQTAMMQSLVDYKDIVIKRVTGEYEQQQFDNQIKQVTSRQQALLINNNPKFARAVAAYDLFKDAEMFPSQKVDIMNMMADFVNGNGDLTDDITPNPFNDSADGKAAFRNYLKIIGQNPDDLTDTQKKEQETQLMGLFNGVTDYESFLEKNPTSAIPLVTEWMSTQNFYRLRTTKPEAFTNVEAAAQVLQSHYGDEVMGMIRREFTDNQIYTESVNPEAGPFKLFTPKVLQDSTPTTGSVAYRSTSNGMEFYAINDGDDAAKRKAKDLNKTLAPVINKNVKAFAHLEGHNDYRGQWEKFSDTIMGGAGQADVAGGDAGDDLEMSDFDQPVKSAPQSVSSGGAKISTNKHMRPIFDHNEGGSHMVREGATERMAETLQGPYSKMVELFGKDVMINDAIAKAGTTRETETPGSRHFHGDALDLNLSGMSEEEKVRLFQAAKEAGFTGFGFGNNILHVDRGPARHWNYGISSFGGVRIADLMTGKV